MHNAQQKAQSLADRYTYRIIWSTEDEEHVATCAEWPYLSCLDKNRQAALEGVFELVVSEIEQRQQTGEEIPEPLSLRQYSGEFRTRIPPELHRALVTEAAEQKISLNRLVSAKLARR
jgi:predicted HicB family RNase H-like nuclease